MSGRTLAQLYCWTSLEGRLSKDPRILGELTKQTAIENKEQAVCFSIFHFSSPKLLRFHGWGIPPHTGFGNEVKLNQILNYFPTQQQANILSKYSRSFSFIPFFFLVSNNHRAVSWWWVSFGRSACISPMSHHMISGELSLKMAAIFFFFYVTFISNTELSWSGELNVPAAR